MGGLAERSRCTAQAFVRSSAWFKASSAARRARLAERRLATDSRYWRATCSWRAESTSGTGIAFRKSQVAPVPTHAGCLGQQPRSGLGATQEAPEVPWVEPLVLDTHYGELRRDNGLLELRGHYTDRPMHHVDVTGHKIASLGAERSSVGHPHVPGVAPLPPLCRHRISARTSKGHLGLRSDQTQGRRSDPRSAPETALGSRPFANGLPRPASEAGTTSRPACPAKLQPKQATGPEFLPRIYRSRHIFGSPQPQPEHGLHPPCSWASWAGHHRVRRNLLSAMNTAG